MDKLYRAYAEYPQKTPIRLYGTRRWDVLYEGKRKSYHDMVALQSFVAELVKLDIYYEVL
jgi:hypothetical protein